MLSRIYDSKKNTSTTEQLAASILGLAIHGYLLFWPWLWIVDVVAFYFGVARVMIICLARICISSDIRVLIYTIVSVEKYYIVLLPTYNDPLSSSHQTIFLSSLSHHAAPVFLTACLGACACFSISRLRM